MADRSRPPVGGPAGSVAGRRLVDGLIAGAVAGLASGLPSTAIARRRGSGLLTAARSAGALLGRPTLPRGLVAHVAVSLGWGVVLAYLFDRLAPAGGEERAPGVPGGRLATAAAGDGSVRAHPAPGSSAGAAIPGSIAAGAAVGAVAGAGIATLDLVVVGRRVPAIRQLPQLPQWLDHLAYGAVAGAVLAVRRTAPASLPASATGLPGEGRPAGKGGQK